MQHRKANTFFKVWFSWPAYHVTLGTVAFGKIMYLFFFLPLVGWLLQNPNSFCPSLSTLPSTSLIKKYDVYYMHAKIGGYFKKSTVKLKEKIVYCDAQVLKPCKINH